jgi:N-carbamoylputrescine amidase
VLAQASASEEGVLVTECDPKLMDEVRRNWPFLRDRRIDAYAPITKRWLA